MPISSQRSIRLDYSEDLVAGLEFNAAANPESPGVMEQITLASGNNTISVPDSNCAVTAVTIVPPEDNEEIITLKGVNDDTGIALHLTDPFTLSLGAAVTSFVLNAAAEITGVRFYWS